MATTYVCYVVAIFFLCATARSPQRNYAPKGETTLDFKQREYVHRWSQNDQHEFTPSGQENLSKWTDMLTINSYRQVNDAEGLAVVANRVLENYKNQRGIVLKTVSVPRTAEKPAEHLIVVVLGRPTFLEGVQARFKLIDGKGVSIVHSHRVYGKEVGPEMSEWLKLNGPSIERALMAWELPPSLAKLGH
jgi:hypothetical protein